MPKNLFLIKVLFILSVCFIDCNAFNDKERNVSTQTSKEKINNTVKSANNAKKSHRNYKHTGIASWYGDEFKGKKMASGQAFDPKKLTAAHNFLPINTVVRVTNLSNRKSVNVTITDRGPHKRLGRVIDLSSQAAKQLQFSNEGITKVEVKYLYSE